jgi:hypothetical protein
VQFDVLVMILLDGVLGCYLQKVDGVITCCNGNINRICGCAASLKEQAVFRMQQAHQWRFQYSS